MFGVEGQFSWTDLGKDFSATNGGLTATLSTDVNWIATIAARFGVAFGNALIYGKGGVAFMDFSATACLTGFGCATRSDTETGWMVGVGLDSGFTPNWSAKIEYNFNRFEEYRRQHPELRDVAAFIYRRRPPRREGRHQLSVRKLGGPVVARY